MNEPFTIRLDTTRPIVDIETGRERFIHDPDAHITDMDAYLAAKRERFANGGFGKMSAEQAERFIHGTATQIADAGGQLACDFAARLTGTDWKAAAEAFTLGFIRQRGTAQCSDVRELAREYMPELEHEGIDPRAWGGVFRSLARAGKVKACGYLPTDRRMSHGRQEMVWQYVEA